MLSNVRGSHRRVMKISTDQWLYRFSPTFSIRFFSMTENITEKQCARRLYSEHNRICEAAGVTAVFPFKANTYCMRCNRSPVAPVTEEEKKKK